MLLWGETAQAHFTAVDAMDMALLTGQRTADVLKLKRINERLRKAISAFLIQDETGQPPTQGALRSRFDKARTLAKVAFQFRDIRAQAATDTGSLAHLQKLLGHRNREMTEHCVKVRMGERVKPLRLQVTVFAERRRHYEPWPHPYGSQ